MLISIILRENEETARILPDKYEEVTVVTACEVLLFLTNILDPVRSCIWELKDDILGLKSDVEEMRFDVSEMKARIKKVELTQENIILPRLKTIENYNISSYERDKRCEEACEMLKQDMITLEEKVAKLFCDDSAKAANKID